MIAALESLEARGIKCVIPLPRSVSPAARTRRRQRMHHITAISGSNAPVSSDREVEVGKKKWLLRQAVSGTQRGAAASSQERGMIEEAQVALEECSPPHAEWRLLEGTWDVIYTTAGDVLPLVRSPPIPLPFRVGRVGQRFTSPEAGIVQNLIEVEAIDPVLNGTTATLVVEASYTVQTARSLALQFQKAGVQGVELGSALQTLAAPALLPRGWINMRLLQSLVEVSAPFCLQLWFGKSSTWAPCLTVTLPCA